MKLLKGHTSPETAYLVADYPYGFTLRCQIRYWLEWHHTRGFRFVSQTTNPKRPGIVWNKPKASTYSKFGGAMYVVAVPQAAPVGTTEIDDLAVLLNTTPQKLQATLAASVAAAVVEAATL